MHYRRRIVDLIIFVVPVTVYQEPADRMPPQDSSATMESDVDNHASETSGGKSLSPRRPHGTPTSNSSIGDEIFTPLP
jgi:hypothetical protein